MHAGRCTLSYEVFKGENLQVENSLFSRTGQFCDFVIICCHACLVASVQKCQKHIQAFIFAQISVLEMYVNMYTLI